MGCGQAPQAPRGANTEALAHEKPEVEGGSVNEHAFSNLLLSANVDATQASGHEHVRKPPLQLLAALAQRPLHGLLGRSKGRR